MPIFLTLRHWATRQTEAVARPICLEENASKGTPGGPTAAVPISLSITLGSPAGGRREATTRSVKPLRYWSLQRGEWLGYKPLQIPNLSWRYCLTTPFGSSLPTRWLSNLNLQVSGIRVWHEPCSRPEAAQAGEGKT